MIAAKDFYLLRSPVLPLTFLDQFEALTWEGLAEKLKEIYTEPFLQEAIYVASPELFTELQKWQAGSATGKSDGDKLSLSLMRYLLRMSSRCTPFGLFAGYALGAVNGTTKMTVNSYHRHRKLCRLDMNYAAELAAMISALPHVQQQLKFFPNNSLYQVADKYRYTEFSTKDKLRTYHLTMVDYSQYLEKILGAAERGSTLAELADTIISDDITGEEANEFLEELVRNQLLVSELEPTLTGEEFLNSFIKKLDALNNTSDITQRLSHINGLLNQDGAGINKYIETYNSVKALLPDTSRKDLVQTDLMLATSQNSLSATVIETIQKRIEKIWCLARLNNNRTDLENFMRAFEARYEGEEVPLLIALDADAGIGYAAYSGCNADHAPLIDDIPVTARAASPVSPGKMQEFQLEKLHACLYNGSMEIVLTDTDLESIKDTETPAIPDSFYVKGTILGQNAHAVDAGDFEFELHSCGGPSVANLLGRFCQGDEKLTAHVKACLHEEESNNPDMIYAEVVHLPEARTGNVLMRPQLRDYEIVFLGNGSVPADHQIQLTDLMVSVHNKSIILRSKRLNKRIVPRLSTAHNYTGGLPAYQFLCDLQAHQLHSAAGWRWNLSTNEKFLPRVRYKNVILSKCTWILHKKDYPELMQNRENPILIYRKLFEEISRDLRIPDHVVIVEGDNVLYINLKIDACVLVLANLLVKKEQVELQEFLATPDRCIVESKNGRYTNEIIIPFSKVTKPEAGKLVAGISTLAHRAEYANQPDERAIRSSFITGSEWLYVKIYCGTTSAERILRDIIKPLTTELAAENVVDKWFFIRYEDPDNHLRLRLHHASDPGFWKKVLERLHLALEDSLEHNLAYKVQLDTYKREISRYGAATMEFSEDIFYHDSEAVISCIDLLEGEAGEKFRWLLAARGIDLMLQDFGYNLEGRAAMIKKMQQSYFKEFGGSKMLGEQLKYKYRQHMRLLSSFMNEADDAQNEIEEAIAVFNLRSVKIRAALAGIKDLSGGKLLDKLVPNYLHMFLNRILVSNPRKHELVIYYFLSKHYDSRIAIHKQHLQIN